MPAKLPIATEKQEQKALFEWWAHFAQANGLDVNLLIAIPNGSHLAGDARQRAIQMRNLKASGLRPKAPDVILAVPRGVYHGMWLELKRRDWTKPKTEHEVVQRNYLWLLQSMGYRAEFAAGADSAMRLIAEYLRAA